MSLYNPTMPSCTKVQHARSIEGCRGLPSYSAAIDDKQNSQLIKQDFIRHPFLQLQDQKLTIYC